MSWEDRDWNRGSGDPRGLGRPGGDWRGMRPRIDNPMSWSVGLGRYFGIEVRVHVILLFFIVIELLRSIAPMDRDSGGLAMGAFFTIIFLAGLFALVLLHEFGHCIACRRSGGEAREILMWPLGGLAYCLPPNYWKAHMWTVVGGPAVNVMFLPVFAIAMQILAGDWRLGMPIPYVTEPSGAFVSNTSTAVFIVAQVNMMLLLFNLLPMFPLDGGRFLQSVLWPKMGYVRSMRLALRIGYFGAIALGVYGIVSYNGWLIAIAAFGGITCWMTHKQLEFTEQMMGMQHDEYALGLGGEDFDPSHEQRKPRGPSKREIRKQEKEAEQLAKDEHELNRLLDKIKTSGMDSLTGREKRWLERESHRKRGR